MTDTLWPRDEGFTGVFDTHQDPNPGEAIEDKYGFVSFGTGAVAGTSQFPNLGISGLALLDVIDPEESKRVNDATDRRAALRRRRNKTPSEWPDWLIHDTYTLSESEEKEALQRAGLTLEGAKKLVAAKGQRGQSAGSKGAVE